MMYRNGQILTKDGIAFFYIFLDGVSYAVRSVEITNFSEWEKKEVPSSNPVARFLVSKYRNSIHMIVRNRGSGEIYFTFSHEGKLLAIQADYLTPRHIPYLNTSFITEDSAFELIRSSFIRGILMYVIKTRYNPACSVLQDTTIIGRILSLIYGIIL